MNKVFNEFYEKINEKGQLVLSQADEQEIVKRIGKLNPNNQVNRKGAIQTFQFAFDTRQEGHRYYLIIDKLLSNGLQLGSDDLTRMFQTNDVRLREICFKNNVDFNGLLDEGWGGKVTLLYRYHLTKDLLDNPDAFKQIVLIGLEWGMNINTQFYRTGTHPCTLLSFTLVKRRPALVSFLLEQGADPNLINRTINEVVLDNQVDTFSLMLPHLKGYVFRGNHWSPKEPMIRLLMDHRMIEDDVVYAWGVYNDNVDVLVNLPPNQAVCQTLIYKTKTREVFDVLISRGATVDPDALLKLENTPSVDLVSELIDTYKVSLDMKNEEQQTPLAVQLQKGNLTVAQLIFEKGGKMDPEQVTGILFDLLEKSDSKPWKLDEELENWIKLLFDPKRINDPIQRQYQTYGQVLLIRCLDRRLYGSIKTLLQLGADPNVCEINSNRDLVSPMFHLWRGSNTSPLPKNIRQFKEFPFMALLVYYGSSVAGLPSTVFKSLAWECEKWQYLFKKMQDADLCPNLVKKVFGYSTLRTYLVSKPEPSNPEPYPIPVEISPAVDDGRKIRITTGEGEFPDLPRCIFQASVLIVTMLEDDDEMETTEIPLQNITTKTMQHVIEFLKLYWTLSKYNVISRFMLKRTIGELFDLLKAGDYLDIPYLEYRVICEINYRMRLSEDVDQLLSRLSMNMPKPKQRLQVRKDSDWILSEIPQQVPS